MYNLIIVACDRRATGGGGNGKKVKAKAWSQHNGDCRGKRYRFDDPGGDLLEDTAYDSADIPVLRAPQGDPTMFADDCACDCACPCMS